MGCRAPVLGGVWGDTGLRWGQLEPASLQGSGRGSREVLTLGAFEEGGISRCPSPPSITPHCSELLARKNGGRAPPPAVAYGGGLTGLTGFLCRVGGPGAQHPSVRRLAQDVGAALPPGWAAPTHWGPWRTAAAPGPDVGDSFGCRLGSGVGGPPRVPPVNRIRAGCSGEAAAASSQPRGHPVCVPQDPPPSCGEGCWWMLRGAGGCHGVLVGVVGSPCLLWGGVCWEKVQVVWGDPGVCGRLLVLAWGCSVGGGLGTQPSTRVLGSCTGSWDGVPNAEV